MHQDTRQTIINVDAPHSGVLTSPVTFFTGWISGGPDIREMEVRINGRPHPNVSTFERPDVGATRPEDVTSGWAFHCDLAAFMTEGQHALVVDFLVAGAPMQRQRYRCALDVRNPPEKSMTFYMHIGKTGGTSIRRAIEATSALKMMPVYGDDPQFIDAPQFAQLSEFALNDVDLVYGHFGYGLHATARRPYRYVTMLRDPYQLARSLYFFKKYVHRDEYFRSFATVEAALENFPAMATDNPICRALAGRAAAGPVTAEDFEQAKANMVRDFAVVGVMEHFDDSVAMLSDYLGVTLEARFENQTPATPESRALDMKSFRRAARPVLEHDIALYNFALETFWGGSLA